MPMPSICAANTRCQATKKTQQLESNRAQEVNISANAPDVVSQEQASRPSACLTVEARFLPIEGEV